MRQWTDESDMSIPAYGISRNSGGGKILKKVEVFIAYIISQKNRSRKCKSRMLSCFIFYLIIASLHHFTIFLLAFIYSFTGGMSETTMMRTTSGVIYESAFG